MSSLPFVLYGWARGVAPYLCPFNEMLGGYNLSNENDCWRWSGFFLTPHFFCFLLFPFLLLLHLIDTLPFSGHTELPPLCP